MDSTHSQEFPWPFSLIIPLTGEFNLIWHLLFLEKCLRLIAMKSSPVYLPTLSNALWNLLRIETQCTNLCLISSVFCITLFENQNICLVSSPPPLAGLFQDRTKHLLLILQVPWCPVIHKPEAKTLQLLDDLCQSVHRLVFCYLEATFIFTLFSLRIILLDRENGGKIDTENFCFFFVTGFKLQACLELSFFSELI